MQYQGMPDLTGQGLKNVHLINETSLFSKTTLGVSNEWSDSAPWWTVTEAFMAEHQIN
jgi:hypothetical protein